MLRHVALLAMAFASSGCASCVDLEGESIAAGNYVDLVAFEAGEGGILLSAIGGWNGTEGVLTVVHLDGSLCQAGPASAYGPIPTASALGTFQGYATWLETTDEGVGDVSFYDLGCTALLGPIEGVVTPIRLFPSSFLGSGSTLFLISGDARWWTVDPFAGQVAELAGPMSVVLGAADDAAWVLEDGTLYVRGFDGQTRREVASGVTELSWPPPSLDPTLHAAVYVDAAGVELLEGPDDPEPELVAADACEVHPVFADQAPILGYLAPCSDQQLVLHDLASGTVTPIAQGVSAFDWDADPLYFVSGPEPGHSTGDLYVTRGGTAPKLVAEEADLWTLEQHDYDTPPYALVLTHRTPTGGTLLRVGEDGSAESWHTGVAQVDDLADHIAVLADFDGTTGNLYLHPEAGGDPELLAGGVPEDGFDLGWQLRAIGYIADAQSGAGRLVVRELDGDREQEVDQGVTEFAEVLSEDRPGIAYLIGSGERAGIWYAEP
jgi:hypothetical protein